MTAETHGPIREVPLPSAHRLDADLGRRAEALRSAARRTRRGSDEEAIHDLRVAVRRFEAACWTWTFLREDPRVRRSLRTASRLRRRLGRAREHEVLLDQLRQHLDEASSAARIGLSDLLGRIEHRVERGRANAARWLRRPRARRRLRRLRDRLRRPVLTLAERPGAFEAAVAIARTRRSIRHREALAAVQVARAGRTDESLHAARIAIKRWRYAEESLAAVDPPSAKVSGLRDLQETLGHIHDAAVLRDALIAESERLDAAGLPSAAVRDLAGRVEDGRLAQVGHFESIDIG